MKFTILVTLLFFVFSISHSQSIFHEEIKPFFDEAQKPFYFGVASGDPRSNSVIIWTKIFSETIDNQHAEWEIATDEAMQQVVQSGTEKTTYAKAFSIKRWGDVQF